MSKPASLPWFIGMSLLLAVLSACNLPQATPTKAPWEISTQMAATLIALEAQIQNALPSTSTVVPSASPSAAPATASPTASPTVSPSPSLTPTPAIPHISVSKATYCREGPGKVFHAVGALQVGEEAEVLGRSTWGDYWYVRLPNGQTCWLWGQYAQNTEALGNVPPVTPPPSPTPQVGLIWGYVYHDTNRNGVFDSGEAPYTGLEVYLSSATSGHCDFVTLSTTHTDAQGRYTFEVEPGTYCVTLPGGPSWCPWGNILSGDDGAAVVTARPEARLDFGDLGCSPMDPACHCP